LFAAGTAAGAVAVGEERAPVVVTGVSDFWQPITPSETITRTAISARIFFTKVTSLLSYGFYRRAWTRMDKLDELRHPVAHYIIFRLHSIQFVFIIICNTNYLPQ